MKAVLKKRNQRSRPISVEIEVSYVPFPDEKSKALAYDTHAALFLKAKERMLKTRQEFDRKEPLAILNNTKRD